MDAPRKSVYFPGLNGLRFIAALLVIISHVEELKLYFHYDNIRENPTVLNMGSLSVTFFFVLSGFLITYLLMEEKSQKGYISLKDFYLKRVVRIWPLYYLIILLGLFVIPMFPFMDIPEFSEAMHDHFFLNSVLLFSILPNVAFANGLSLPYMVQTWSIGVEEQFYIIWPLVIWYSKRYLRGIGGTIAIYIGIVMTLHLGIRLFDDSFLKVAMTFVKLTRIDCMAIGGVGAWLVFRQQKDRLAILYNPVYEVLAWIVAIVLIAKPVQFPAFTQEIYSLVYLVIILNVATNPATKANIILENRILNYLGKISYGLYMYHFIFIGLSIAWLRSLGFVNSSLGITGNTLLYTLVIGLTIAVASLSFHTFEGYFMQIRPLLSRVLSRQRLADVLAGIKHLVVH